MQKLAETLNAIRPLYQEAVCAAQARHAQLTKPMGSLGCLEEISVRLAGIQGTVRPDVSQKAVFVMAGDHGVARESVSAYPQEVTAQMVDNFLQGGAAINVLARHAGARVKVADMGVASNLEPHPELVVRKINYGTRNIARGPAMSQAEVLEAVKAGIEVFEAEYKKGLQLAATGDMGIGNTTPSAALLAVFTGLPAAEVAGRGTGVDDKQFANKVNAIEQALAVNQPDPCDPISALAKVGGFEIAGLVGVILAGAAHRVPVVIDGFISGAAALVATALAPQAKDFLFAGHQSVEPGHQAMLAHMGLKPILNLDLRLGEGTGAVLAMQLIEAAAKILNEMATFDEAGVSEAS